MDKLFDLLRESVLVQGLLALSVIGVVLYLAVQGKEIPRDLWGLTALILGFYFGSKVENAKMRKMGR